MSIEWASAEPDEILAHLQDVDTEVLEELLENDAFNEDHVRVLLKNPRLEAEAVDRLSREPRFFRRGIIRVALVMHPHISRVRALELVPYLFWRDALRVARSPAVHPQVRVVAEHAVAERLPELTPGERMTIARTATRPVLQALRTDKDARVIEAVMQNFRCTEEDVLLITSIASTPPQVLGLVARHPKWRLRPAIRSALVRNRRLPLPIALGILEQLSANELQVLSRQAQLPKVLRESARRLARELQGSR